jgi:hypothetical protein
MSYNSTRPDMTGWWKCCKCSDGTYYNPDLTTKCVACEHIKCGLCETYTTPPATPAEVGQHSIDEVDFSSSSPGGVQYAYPPQPLHASPIQPLAFSKTPSMKGWWKCCECEGAIDPKVNSNTCPQCYHDKCDSCTTYTA